MKTLIARLLILGFFSVTSYGMEKKFTIPSEEILLEKLKRDPSVLQNEMLVASKSSLLNQLGGRELSIDQIGIETARAILEVLTYCRSEVPFMVKALDLVKNWTEAMESVAKEMDRDGKEVKDVDRNGVEYLDSSFLRACQECPSRFQNNILKRLFKDQQEILEGLADKGWYSGPVEQGS